MAKKIHIVPHKDGWAVKREGSDRASKVFDKKSDAISHGRQTAKGDKTELIVHSKEGEILDRNSYGDDPNPSKVGTSGTGAKNKKGLK